MVVGNIDLDPGDDYVQVIEGFWEGAVGLKVNEATVVRLPSEKAYNDEKTRIFEIIVVSIDSWL